MMGRNSCIEENDFTIHINPDYFKVCSQTSHLQYYLFVFLCIIVIPIFVPHQQYGCRLTNKLGAVFLFFFFSSCQSRDQQTFSINVHIVNILGFMSLIVFHSYSLLLQHKSSHRESINECMWPFPIKLSMDIELCAFHILYNFHVAQNILILKNILKCKDHSQFMDHTKTDVRVDLTLRQQSANP